MGEIMKKYFKEHWKWLCLFLIFPIIFTIFTFFMNNSILGNLTAYTDIVLIIAILILLIWFIIGVIRKSYKLSLTLLLIAILSATSTYGYARILGPHYYTYSESGIMVNGFQRHRLKVGTKKIKQIDKAINSDNHSETEKAKTNTKYLRDYILKHSNDNSLRNLTTYSYKTLNNDLGNSNISNDDTNDSNALRNLALNYGWTVFEQHNSKEDIRKDSGKSMIEFMRSVNQ